MCWLNILTKTYHSSGHHNVIISKLSKISQFFFHFFFIWNISVVPCPRCLRSGQFKINFQENLYFWTILFFIFIFSFFQYRVQTIYFLIGSKNMETVMGKAFFYTICLEKSAVSIKISWNVIMHTFARTYVHIKVQRSFYFASYHLKINFEKINKDYSTKF